MIKLFHKILKRLKIKNAIEVFLIIIAYEREQIDSSRQADKRWRASGDRSHPSSIQ